MKRLEVLPDPNCVDQRLLELSCAQRLVDGRGVCTLADLVERCDPFRWAHRGPAEPLLVVSLIAAASAASSALEAYGPFAASPQFAYQAHQLIASLRAQAVSSQQLSRIAAQASGALAERVAALAQIWAHVDLALEELQLVDPGDVLRLAAQRLKNAGLPRGLSEYSHICVRSLYDWYPARLAFFEALARACHQQGVALEVAWPSSGESATDVLVLDAVRQMEARWHDLNVEVRPEYGSGPLAWIAGAAFEERVEPRPAPGLRVVSVASAGDEARFIARSIRTLVSQGVPCDDVAIVFRDLGAEADLLSRALAQQGLPVRACVRKPLGDCPVARAALGLFELADDDFPALGFSSLIECAVPDLSERVGMRPLRAFSEAGIRDNAIGAAHGTGAYSLRLAAYRDRLAARQPLLAKAIEALRQEVVRVLSIAASIPDEAPAQQMLEAWWEAARRLQLLKPPVLLAPSALPPLVQAEIDAAVAMGQAAASGLDAVVRSLRAAWASSGFGGRRVSRADVHRWLVAAAGDVDVAAQGPKTGAVWVLEARMLAGRCFSHVFVGGLTDGRWPGRRSAQPLLSEGEQRELNRLAKAPLFRLNVFDGEAQASLSLAEDRLLLHFALSAASATVTLSHSRRDEAGRECTRSPFIDAISRAVTPLHEEVYGLELAPSLDSALSESEFRVRSTLEVLSPTQTRQTSQDPRRAALEAALAREPWFQTVKAQALAERERVAYFGSDAQPPGAFSGRVDGAALAAVRACVAASRHRPLSAAQLGVWGQCGFRGLAHSVLGLGSADEVGEEIDSRGLGDLLHAALKHLLPPHSAPGRAGSDQSADSIRAAVAMAASELSARSATGHPTLWELAQERVAHTLERLFRDGERAWPFEKAAVQGVEVAFGDEQGGMPHLDSVAIPPAFEAETPIHVRGRIDRVDSTGDALGVVDYKSRAPTAGEARGTLLLSDFQLPLYVWAMSQAHPGIKVRAAWVGLRKRRTTSLDQVLAELGTMDGLLASDAMSRESLLKSGQPNLANAVHGLLAKVRGGDVGPRPHTCAHCEFGALCRISQRRYSAGDEGSGA